LILSWKKIYVREKRLVKADPFWGRVEQPQSNRAIKTSSSGDRAIHAAGSMEELRVQIKHTHASPLDELRRSSLQIAPLVLVPEARRGDLRARRDLTEREYVDSTEYDTTSIAALIEQRCGLAPLGTRDANAGDLTDAFDLEQ
jgi:hypothetical protein